MKIETVNELLDAVVDFDDMMHSDRDMLLAQWDGESRDKAILLSNLIDEFTDIVDFAKNFYQNS